MDNDIEELFDQGINRFNTDYQKIVDDLEEK